MHPQSGNADGTFLLMVEQESAPPPLATMQDPPLATMQDDGHVALNDSTVQQLPPPAQPEERQEEVEQSAADPDGDEGKDLLFDGNNNVFIGLDNYQDGQNEHCQKWNSYILEKDAILGVTVTKGQGVKSIVWKVSGDVSDANLPLDINAEYQEVGVCGFDFTANNTQSYEDAPQHTNLISLLIQPLAR